MASVALFKPKGRKVWYLKWRDNDGTQILRSTKTEDKALAKKAHAALEAELTLKRFGIESARKDFTPKDAWEFYEEHQANPNPAYLRDVRWRFLKFFRDTNIPTLGAVRPTDIIRWQKQRLKDGIKPTTINKAFGDLQLVYKKLIKWKELSGSNPFDEVDLLDVTEEVDRWAWWEDVERLLAVAWATGRDEFLDDLLKSHLGLRFEEVPLQRWEHINWAERWIDVKGTKTKGSTARLPLSPELYDYLLPYREDSGPIVKETNSYFRRKGFRERAVTANFRNVAGEIGTPHTLRHAYAVRLLQQEQLPHIVCRLMRHAGLGMTDHYAKIKAILPKIDRL
jgi:integrase